MKGEYPVRLLCELQEVSPSGYYRWRQKRPSQRQRDDAALAARIAAAHRASRRTYGAPRIVEDLREEGIRCQQSLRPRCKFLPGEALGSVRIN